MYKRMSDREFAIILQKVFAGNINAIYQIIDIYDGLILKYSTVNGTYNQECRDYIENN